MQSEEVKPTLTMPDYLGDKLTQDNNCSAWGDVEQEDKEVLEVLANKDDVLEEIYLISDLDDPTAFGEEGDDFADEEPAETDETSEPIPQTHVMHKHSVFEVLDGDLLQTLVKAVISANFFWTRIGLSEEEALEKLVDLEVQLKAMLNDFTGHEKEQYLVAVRQIRRLKDAIHSVTADLETLIGEEQLTALISLLNEQESPHGADQKVDSYLRVQKAALKIRLQTLLQARNQRLEEFDRLKADCFGTVRQLGLTTADALESSVAAILEERIATYEEVELLQQATDMLRVRLEERVAYCQALSAEVMQIGQLVPVENIYLDNRLPIHVNVLHDEEADGDGNGKEEVIYSEKRLHKLKRLHTEVHLAALKTWTELKETSSQLVKLYRLFEVVDPESRHLHFNIVEAVQAKLSEQMQQQQQEQQQVEEEEEEEEEETTEHAPQSDSFLLLQTLVPFFADQGLTLKDALKSLGAELAFYTQQKSERISELIVVCRAQFARKLADCLVSMEALKGDGRFGFLFTGQEHFDEHLLDVHQAELDRLRQYAAKHEVILSLVAKWRRLKEEATELEAEMVTGAGHIRTNRGGILEKMLAKQRANKKQLSSTTAQIGAWLVKQRTSQQTGQKTELDRLLPFELYSLRVEDIEREVGPVVQQRVQSPSVRRSLYGSGLRPAKLSTVTPSTATYSTFGRSTLALSTPLYAKSKKLPVIKVKLFQSVPSSAIKTSNYRQQREKKQPPTGSAWRTAYQAKSKYY